MVRRILIATVSALVVGVLLGGTARVLMRLVALADGQSGHFSWGGTVSIVLAYAIAALPGCLLAASTRRRGRSLLLVAGALFLCIPATGIASDEVRASGLSAWQVTGVLTAGAGIYATVLALPVVALRLLDAALPGGRERRQAVRPELPAPRPPGGPGAREEGAEGRSHRGALGPAVGRLPGGD